MNKIITILLCLTMGMSMAAHAESKQEKKARKAEQRAAKAAAKSNITTSGPRVRANVPRQRIKTEASLNNNARLRGGQFRNQKAKNRTVVVQENNGGDNRKFSGRNRNFSGNKKRNVVVERKGPSNHYWKYSEARRHHRRDRHDRRWWRRNYSRFSIFAGGYYYWDRGYWYPAYGYDPYYNNYRYNEPIYGGNYVEPGQIIVNVQVALKRQGYYYGSVDGLIGPMTRSALARFQRDYGLDITRAIDGPTLSALGVV